MQTAFVRRTWIEIGLDKVVHNYAQACGLCGPGTRVTCVLKANAYGHGAVEVARTLEAAGAESFAVSCVREALELRGAGIHGEILVMGIAEAELLPAALKENVHLTVASLRQARQAEEAVQETGCTAALHVKLDTGLHRLGFAPGPEAIRDILAIGRLPHVQVQGLYSHLALTNRERDEMQHRLLKEAYDALAAAGLHIPELHLCDSIGMVRYPQWHYSRVRTGAMLFGVRPMGSEEMDFTCEESLCMKTIVSQVTEVAAGEYIGYDSEGPLTRPSRIATLCAGYGDGYPRCMSRVASVLVRGKPAPVMGLICMDQMMVDVTDIPGVAEGDEATLLGGGIPYMEYAGWAKTNRNEAITIMSRRPPRVYVSGGQIVKVVDYMLEDGGLLP